MSNMNLDEIAELKTKLQAIIFSIDAGIVMIDFEGNILVINDSAKRMLDIKKGYPYEKKFLDYVENDRVKEELRRMLDSKEAMETKEFVIRKTQKIQPTKPDLKKGEHYQNNIAEISQEDGEIFVKVTRKNVTTAKGDVIGRVIAMQEITLEKQLEKIKEDFIHGVTHDLKSPISSVQDFIRLFLEGELGELSDEQKHYLKIMLHSTEKSLRMINNILDSAKLKANKMSIYKNDWNAVTAVQQIVNTMQGIARHHKVKLYATIKSDEKNKPIEEQSIVLKADNSQIERAIANLIDNALKFTPSGGEIEVQLIDHPGKIELFVRDTGKGIPEELLEKIFKKFQQVPGTKGGSGLGLTITRQIIEMHGGRIDVHSHLGQGSTFHFWIPKK